VEDIAGNLARVKSRIGDAAEAAGRDAEEITLLAVSKTQPAEAIEAALAAGHLTFAENRLQETEEKWPALKAAHPKARLHLIGPLQRNKARRAIELCDVIETVDRPKLAHALARLMAETGRRPDCFLQINTGEEPQKAGVLPGDADTFIRLCRDDLALPVRGLMCIPPADEEASLHFALLRMIASRNGLSDLSMGMSSDFETAIQFGATLVRVGTAIFGARRRPPEG
jgi:hypothetical protein